MINVMPILGASIGTLNDIYVYIYILISIYIRIHVPYIFGLAVEARVQPNSSRGSRRKNLSGVKCRGREREREIAHSDIVVQIYFCNI